MKRRSYCSLLGALALSFLAVNSLNGQTLKAHYKFSENGGDTIADSSGNAKNISISRSGNNVTLADGFLNQIDSGSGDGVLTPDLGFTSNINTYTFAAWIKPDAAGVEYWSGIVSTKDGASVGLNVNTDGSINWHYPGVSYGYGGTNLKVVLGKWNFVAMVVSADKIEFYQSSDYAASSALSNHSVSGTPSVSSLTTMYIGRDGTNNGRQFIGSMDEVRIWEGSMTASALETLFDAEKAAFGAIAVAMDDDFATTKGVELTGQSVVTNDNLAGATVHKLTDPASGSVTVNADGTFSYTPTADFVGTVTFDYKLSSDGGTNELDTATVTINVVDTLANYAVNFPANSDTITLDTAGFDDASNGLTGKTACTLSFWANATSYTNDNHVNLTSAEGEQLRLHFPWDNAVYWDAANASGSNYARVSVPLTTAPLTGGWHHWAFTYDQATTTSKIYYDGTMVAENTSVTANTFSSITSATIGSGMTGAMDEISIWNRALDSTEIGDLKSHTLKGNEENLVCYLPFIEGAGTTSTDASTMSHNVTFNGNSSWVASGATLTGVLTPALGLEIEVVNNVLSWTLTEAGVEKFLIVDETTGAVVAEVVADGSGSYSYQLEDNIKPILKVVDQSGYTQLFTVESDEKVTLELNQGWNLLSLPFAQQLDESAFVWDTKGQQYVESTEINSQQGFWLYLESAKIVSFEGNIAENSVVLDKGWNLFGPVKNMEAPSDLTIYGWDAAYQQTNIMTVGSGYWIFSTDHSTVISPE